MRRLTEGGDRADPDRQRNEHPDRQDGHADIAPGAEEEVHDAVPSPRTSRSWTIQRFTNERAKMARPATAMTTSQRRRVIG